MGGVELGNRRPQREEQALRSEQERKGEPVLVEEKREMEQH